MLRPGKTYKEVYQAFQWEIPEFYNIGVDICDKWAPQRNRLALIYENEDGRVEKYTFRGLKRLSNQLANGLQAYGLVRGDRFGILLPQCPETAICHIAAYKIGAIAIPLFTLFGTDALAYRLSNSEAKGIVTDASNLPKIMEIWANLPHLKTVLVTGGAKRRRWLFLVQRPQGRCDYQCRLPDRAGGNRRLSDETPVRGHGSCGGQSG